MPELTPDVALAWIERWERQQEEALPEREERFTVLIDALWPSALAGTTRS